MRILFFSPYFYPYTSGLTTYPLKILTYLSKKNDITILTFPFKKQLAINNQQSTIKYLPYLSKISKGFISPQSLIYFYKYAKNSDLIILNQPNFEGLFLAFFGKIFRKKIISIFHCQVFLANNIWNTIINFFLNFSMKQQLMLSDKIVAYTEDYFDSLDNLKQFRKKTVFTLPPIDKTKPNARFLKRLLKMKQNDIWIGYAGRIASEKGLEYLVQSINRLGIKKNIELVFAGPYGKDVAEENIYYLSIRQLLKKYKIKNIFLGNLNSKQLCAFYKSIDMLVLPSINQTEAFGMVQAEAMIAGTPIVASNLPGVRIPIRLTKMGLVVEPKNSEKLSQVILEVLKNKNKYSNKILVNNAKKIFDIKKVYKFYDQLLTTL